MTIPERHLGDARAKIEICLYDTFDLEYIREKTKHYKIPDRFDAFCLFEFESIDALRRYGESSNELDRMHMMSVFHRSFLSDEIFAEQKA